MYAYILEDTASRDTGRAGVRAGVRARVGVHVLRAHVCNVCMAGYAILVTCTGPLPV